MSKVTVVFEDRLVNGKVGKLEIPWVPNAPLRHYLSDPLLREQHFMGRLKSIKIFSERKQVHLAFTPKEDSFVYIKRTARVR